MRDGGFLQVFINSSYFESFGWLLSIIECLLTKSIESRKKLLLTGYLYEKRDGIKNGMGQVLLRLHI